MSTISTFATAFLFLNLAAMTGVRISFVDLNLVLIGLKEMVHFEKCQLLYVNLMSVSNMLYSTSKAGRADFAKITQRHGLFAASEGQLLDTGLYEAFPDLSSRWKAWSKVESTKRYTISALGV